MAVSEDDSWLEDDGRDGGKDDTPALESAVWWCVAAGIMLLLPRQWASAGMAFALAAILFVIKRVKHGPSKKDDKGGTKAERASDDEAQGSQSLPT